MVVFGANRQTHRQTHSVKPCKTVPSAREGKKSRNAKIKEKVAYVTCIGAQERPLSYT